MYFKTVVYGLYTLYGIYHIYGTYDVCTIKIYRDLRMHFKILGCVITVLWKSMPFKYNYSHKVLSIFKIWEIKNI